MSPALVVVGVFVLFIAVLIIRALLFRPGDADIVTMSSHEFDRDTVSGHLSRMIRIPTVSSRDPGQVDSARFDEFRALLGDLYPTITAQCERTLIGETGVVYRWKGRSPDDATVLMAHYDVVAADSAEWDKPPFSGEIDDDGVLWGRGAIDTKITLCAILEAVEMRMRNGFVPEHDVYLSFSGDEEIMGPSAPAIVAWMEEKSIHPALVLDEGGAVVTGVFPGVKKPCAVVGITEKGVLDIEFSARAAGGHSSAPALRQPVVDLAKAIEKISRKPFPLRLTPAAAKMFNTLGRHSSFAFRLLFANLWCFLPLFKLVCKLSGGELAALMRTTCCFTVLEGAPQYNVMPPVARSGANLRLLPGDTAVAARDRLEKIVRKTGVTLRTVYAYDPSPVADLDGYAWKRVHDAVASTWPDAIVSPYLMVACTDSRHFCRVSPTVLKFSAMALTKEERASMHAKNERIPVDKIVTACQFFWRILETA